MQLFITEQFVLQRDTIIVEEHRIIHQCNHVLRLQRDASIQIQNSTTRYTVIVQEINKKHIIWRVKDRYTLTSKNTSITIGIAYPNRWTKAELIIQKLTEIGVSRIVFIPFERSLKRTPSTQKQKRFDTIMIEASEQSGREHLPELLFLDTWDKNYILSYREIVFFHQTWTSLSKKENNKNIKSPQNTIGIIWPEWWFSESEHVFFLENSHKHYALGDNILRMETAAIIAWRVLTNQLINFNY